MRPGRHITIVLLGLVGFAASLTLPVSANACGAYRHSKVVRLKPKEERAPLIIGDSTMIFAVPYLAHRGFEADAKGCRQFGEGVAMLSKRKQAHLLPRVSILALGANGPIAGKTIEHALKILGRHRVLGLVTPRKSGISSQAMRHAARRHGDRVLLIDWVAFSAPHGGWFGGDGLHVNYTGAKEFAKLVRRKVRPIVSPPVSSLHLPRTTDDAKACGKVRRSRRHLSVFVTRGGSRITCSRARAIVRRPRLLRIPRWRYYDWSVTGRSPWVDVYQRRDRKVVIGVTHQR
jgi:hypothetical protein